ncbi:MAG: hypothetical protein KGH75_01430 [Rhodospirillales bacterium]|nr:hypothetical protein [Rhodospirillales bacterium]
MSKLDKLVHGLTSTYSRTRVIYEMKINHFHKLEYPFVAKRSSEDWFIYKSIIFHQDTKLSVDANTVELFYGELHTLRFDDYNVGFIINLPKMEHKVQGDVLISGPKSTDAKELSDNANVLLTTDNLSVFVLDDTIQYIATHDKQATRKFG